MSIDTVVKTIYCEHCEQEIKGDAWYMGQFVSYTHADKGNFLCDPLNWNNNNHAEPAK